MSAGAAVMNVRQSNKDTQVLTVGGEMFDQEGHRVDVTVWFRHRNEALYYLDSGGNLHGPLDLKHSSKLDGMRKSGGSFIKRSWVGGQRSQSSTRSEDTRAIIAIIYEFPTVNYQLANAIRTKPWLFGFLHQYEMEKIIERKEHGHLFNFYTHLSLTHMAHRCLRAARVNVSI